jgi:hypothetical protein
MDEIKQTLTILKNRWYEVALLIGLWALHRLIALTIRIYPDIQALIQIVSISLSILILIVLIGFLRAVSIQQTERQSLGDLIRAGIPFFWRFLILGILGGLAGMVFFWLLPRIIGTESIVFHHVSTAFMKLLLAKLFLLLPALVIVTDCSISESFNRMWKIKLLQPHAKPLLISFLIAYIVLPTLLMLLFPNFWRAGTSITWAAAIPVLYSIFVHIMNLMVSVMAIRFVSSLEITNSPVAR